MVETRAYPAFFPAMYPVLRRTGVCGPPMNGSYGHRPHPVSRSGTPTLGLASVKVPGEAVEPARRPACSLISYGKGMDIAVVVALIAAGVGVLSAVVGSLTALITSKHQSKTAQNLTRLQEKLKAQTREEERLHAAREQLNRHREPLLTAARDVAHRLGNIREGYFLTYLHHVDDRRRLIALRSTLYRFGRYWAVVESLYESVSELRFASEEDTKKVAAVLENIGNTFASDTYEAPRFMVWREEQRGIAELMRDKHQAGEGGVIGFAGFMGTYENEIAAWFAALEHDLQAHNASTSRKLEDLHGLFDELITQLEVDRPRSQ